MRLTRNFFLSEFSVSQTAIRHGIDNSIPIDLRPNLVRLAGWLQTLRDRLCVKYGRDIPIIISSGYRGPKLNKKIGGSKTSSHMTMLAADFTAVGLSVAQLQLDVIELMGEDHPYDQCIDEFSRWVHIGLAQDGRAPRRQNLVARQRIGALGRVTTEYSFL